MKSALLFGALATSIAASLYFTYIRSFVSHDFEITYSEEEGIVEEEAVGSEEIPSPEEGGESATTTEEETNPVMNSE